MSGIWYFESAVERSNLISFEAHVSKEFVAFTGTVNGLARLLLHLRVVH